MTHCEQCQRLRARVWELEKELRGAEARLSAKEKCDEMNNRLISRLTGTLEKDRLPLGATGGDSD